MSLRRGLWIWTTDDVLLKSAEQTLLLSECSKARITDIFLYLSTRAYTGYLSQLRAFVAKCTSQGIAVWGLEGSRAFFSDASGPAELYRNVDALIAYNGKVRANERLVGFQSDVEPDDYSGKYKDTFHVDVKSSALSRSAGSGVWKDTQVLDREHLMRDWLKIHTTLQTKLSPKGLLLGAALPSWLDDYYGEPLLVTYNGVKQTVMKHFVGIVDDYCIMSYQTDTRKVVDRVSGELSYASSKAGSARVFAGVETYKGRGPNVTYGDHPTKNSKTAVLKDIGILEAELKKYSAFAGVCIHDWYGYKNLKA